VADTPLSFRMLPCHHARVHHATHFSTINISTNSLNKFTPFLYVGAVTLAGEGVEI
jgi:hypothetical protein